MMLAGLALLVVVASDPRPSAALPMTDPNGDATTGTYQTYDITSIDAVFDSTNLVISVAVAGTPIAPSVNQNPGISGFIDIDADANPTTGATATIDTLGGGYGNTGLGIEYYIDLFSEFSSPGFVLLKDPINVMNVNQVPIVYGANSTTITVALTLLGGTNGFVNYAVAVGDFGNVTDQALDPTVVAMGGLPASSSPVPEPGMPVLLGLGLAALGARRRA